MGVSAQSVIAGRDLWAYIPQRPPIVMVDRFYGVQEGVSVSGLDVAADNFFCMGEVLDECGVVEHIAQSAALRMGWICRQEGREVPIGYIGAVNKCRLMRRAKVGERMTTRIEIEQEVMNITLMTARVHVGEELIAECRMKIFLDV